MIPKDPDNIVEAIEQEELDHDGLSDSGSGL